jgi:hypothetical protein
MDPTKQGNGRYYPNNRVNMWYLGAQGRVGEALSLTLRTSYSRNFGTPGADYNPVRGQFSSLLDAEYRLAFLGNTSALQRNGPWTGRYLHQKQRRLYRFEKDLVRQAM